MSAADVEVLPQVFAVRPFPGRLVRLYTAEALASVGGTMAMVGMYFYFHTLFALTTTQNLLLATAQGFTYVVGALLCSWVSTILGRRNLTRLINAVMAISMLIALIWPTLVIVLSATLAYAMLAGMNWPALESLVSSGSHGQALSRRIAIYNLVWSIFAVIGMAATGAAVQAGKSTLLLTVLLLHAVSWVILLAHDEDAPAVAHENAQPVTEREFELGQLAMRLSRVILPSNYAVIYAISAIMPTLAVLHTLSPVNQTIVASVWMAARVAAFLLLGSFNFWQSRPRLMLLAGVSLLLSFYTITAAGSIPSILFWEIVLGLASGFIYAGSLYFGMMLSHGSAEQGGYHEALIGAGSILGPGCGAAANLFWPGNPSAGVQAILALLCISTAIAGAVSIIPTTRQQTVAD